MVHTAIPSLNAGFDCGYGGKSVISVGALALPPGESSILLGYNGSGKSTFLKTLCGVLPPVAGVVPAISGCLLPEEVDFCGELKPATILRAFCPLYSHSDLVLDALEIPRRKIFKQLSKGNRQKFRLALTEAMGLCLGRNTMCLDEPLSGLDLRMRETVIGAWEGVGVLGRAWGDYRGHRIISQHSGKTVSHACQTLVAWNGRLEVMGGVDDCENWPRELGYEKPSP